MHEVLDNITIAYSICGEGHGHYGRNVEIIKFLSKNLPNSKIDLYLYGDTYNIFSMDDGLPDNVKIHKIPGFRFLYKHTGIIDSMRSTFTDLDNLSVCYQILKLDFFHTVLFPLKKLFAKIRNKPEEIKNRYYMKCFHDFDFAISDLEPLLPRVADVTNKPFLTLDNQHSMLYCEIDSKQFSLKDRLSHFLMKIALKIYHPTRDLSILTCFYKLPIKKKYAHRVKEVGPVIRENIVKLSDQVEYGDFILVYAHKILRNKLFPLLTKFKDHKYVVFTTDDFEHEDFPYKRDWIEYYSVDPHDFIHHLVRCKAVVSTAGNTLISEAMYLRKPYFGIGLQGNFEQRLNLYMLEMSGWGEGAKISEFGEEHFSTFLQNIESHHEKLVDSNIENNTELLTDMIVDKMISDLQLTG